MKNYEYSYAVIKYRHDIVADEVLNIGVVMYAPECGQIGLMYDHRYRRLSQSFANFDGDMYRKVLNSLKVSIERLGTSLSGHLFELEARERFVDVSSVLRSIWPDQSLSYFSAQVGFGVSDDLEMDLSQLYDRFVVSQVDSRGSSERFDDQQLWDKFKKLLVNTHAVNVFEPVSIGPEEVEFSYAYKNEKWHAIEPLSLDYLDGSEMKKRAYEVAGKVASVRTAEDMGSIYVLLGTPKRTDPTRHYQNAKKILEAASGSVRVIEEEDSEVFAEQLVAEMREHGVID